MRRLEEKPYLWSARAVSAAVRSSASMELLHRYRKPTGD